MTPQDLKNSVLQRAIQGKLVEQRPEEGTGEELYRQIQAEKRRLIQSGKLKKEKPLPEISEDEIPFDIPESWKWVRLGALLRIKSGQGLTSAQRINGSIPVYGGNGITGYHNESFLHKKTIVIGRVGFYCGSVHITEKEAWVTDNAFIVSYPEKYIYQDFLAQILRYMNLGYDNNATAQPVVSGKKIYPLLFPLPPLAEQKRIVAKIEELSPYLDRYAAAWERLETFRQRFPSDMRKSLLQMAIQGKLAEQRPEEGTGEELYRQIQEEKQRLIKSGKLKKEKPLPEISDDEIPFDIPDSWKWARLGAIGNTNIGLTYRPQDISQNGTIVLRSGNIQNGKMDYSDVIRVSLNIPESKLCHKGDLLICARNGSKKLVGKVAVIDRDGMSFGAFMALFKSMCNEYIFYIISSAYFRNSLLGDTGTTTINQITQEVLKNVIVPLPPFAEQRRIVARLEELLPLCERI